MNICQCTYQMSIYYENIFQVPDKAELIRRKKLPVVFAYSLNDRLIEPSIYADMAYNVLGIPDENTVTYADDKTPSRDPLFGKYCITLNNRKMNLSDEESL